MHRPHRVMTDNSKKFERLLRSRQVVKMRGRSRAIGPAVMSERPGAGAWGAKASGLLDGSVVAAQLDSPTSIIA